MNKIIVANDTITNLAFILVFEGKRYFYYTNEWGEVYGNNMDMLDIVDIDLLPKFNMYKNDDVRTTKYDPANQEYDYVWGYYGLLNKRWRNLNPYVDLGQGKFVRNQYIYWLGAVNETNINNFVIWIIDTIQYRKKELTLLKCTEPMCAEVFLEAKRIVRKSIEYGEIERMAGMRVGQAVGQAVGKAVGQAVGQAIGQAVGQARYVHESWDSVYGVVTREKRGVRDVHIGDTLNKNEAIDVFGKNYRRYWSPLQVGVQTPCQDGS